MCGIAGIVGPGAVEHEDAVARMLAALRHRGPDGDGIFRARSGNCVLGHRRLAILDLTDRAAQPMTSPDQRYAFVYNGEIYNYGDVKDELVARGERFVSTGDTEVLFHALMRDSIDAVARLNGMFAFALWDDEQQRLTIARDRFGQKPLYVARPSPRLTVFASEVRALLASGLVARAVDPEGLLSYLSYGAVVAPRTIVRGVESLGPATVAQLDRNGSTVVERRYWSFPRRKHEAGDDELRASFRGAVERHLISDAPLGLFLSGGIDSSAVAAAAMLSRATPLRSLCVVFPDQAAASEAAFARVVAKAAGTEHVEVAVSASSIGALLPAALDAMDQPTVDGMNTYIVSKAARESGLKVVLSGLGGDELFGGYPAFADVPRMAHLRELPIPLRSVAARALAAMPLYAKQPGKLIEMLQSPRGITAAYLVRRRLFSSRQLHALAPSLAGDTWFAGVPDAFREFCEAETSTLEPYDAVALLELGFFMGQMLLRDCDAMGMSHSLEIRTPFLDGAFADLALALPANARAPSARPKETFTRAIADWLPRETRERPKQGFTIPFQAWMVDELRALVTDGIEALCATRLLSPRHVREVFMRFSAQPDAVGWTRPWSLAALGWYLRQNELTA